MHKSFFQVAVVKFIFSLIEFALYFLTGCIMPLAKHNDSLLSYWFCFPCLFYGFSRSLPLCQLQQLYTCSTFIVVLLCIFFCLLCICGKPCHDFSKTVLTTEVYLILFFVWMWCNMLIIQYIIEIEG